MKAAKISISDFYKFLAALCFTSIFLQLAYPSNHTLPGTRINNKRLIFQDIDHTKYVLQDLGNRKFNVVVGSKEYETTPKEIGLDYANDEAIKQVRYYSFGQRFIPFSIFFQGKRNIGRKIKPSVEHAKLESFVAKLTANGSYQPTEAILKVDDGKVTSSDSKPGMRFHANDIAKKLTEMPANIPTRLIVTGETIPPIYNSTALNQAVTQATALIQPITIKINSETYTLSRSDVGSWISFNPDPNTMQINVGFNTEAIKKSLNILGSKVNKPAATSYATMVDGNETTRQIGNPGLFLKISEDDIDKIIQALKSKKNSVELSLQKAPPPVKYNRLYTKSQAGLQALVDYLSTRGSFGISLREITSRGWSASSSGNKVFITASIYKLFVAYSVLIRIDSGEYSWSDSINGTNLTTCFNRMIINSDNPCAEAMAMRVGFTNIINEMHSLGLNNTSHSNTFYSTANDIAILVEKLARGEILSSSSRNYLLGLMKQQIYRKGIPAGTGVSVADKVGFLYGYLNDAAIVYAPGTTYVLIIMSKNSSWSQIADTARQIHAQIAL